MKTMHAVFLAAVLSVSIAVAISAEASCTIGVADGSVSSDGRGLLWKSAMTTDGVSTTDWEHINVVPEPNTLLLAAFAL